MHLLETYALLSGAKIDQSFIDIQEYDIPYSEYIVFHADCTKASARQYKYWNSVLDNLKKDGFTMPIVQIGSLLDHKYNIDLSLLGKTNVYQLAYVIKNSSLFLGYDSFPMHLASHFQKKIVALFCYPAKNSGPYFSQPSDIIVLEPDFSTVKPSYSYDDPEDLINTIDPNTISSSILKLLGISIL